MRLQGELMHGIAEELAMSERTVRRVLADLKTQLQLRHSLHEKDTIRVVALPAKHPPITATQKYETIRRISFTDFVLKQFIGGGGMGKVYRAVSKSTGNKMAVKLLRKELQDSPAIVERFLSEAAVVQQLKHHGLVRVDGTGRTMDGTRTDPVFGQIDYRTDVYGLSALFFTLLTGHPPFKATRIPDVLAQIVSQPPIPPSQLRSGISPCLDDLCLRCLAKLSDRRMASVADFLRSFELLAPENREVENVAVIQGTVSL